MTRWWWQLARYVWPHRRLVVLIGILVLTGVALSALRPWPLKLLVDYVLVDEPLPEQLRWLAAIPGGDSSQGLLFWTALATILVFLFNRLAQIIQKYAESGLGNRLAYELGADLFIHMQRLSLRFHGKWPTGDLVRRVTTDSRCVQDLVLAVFFPILTSLMTLMMMFAIMWQLHRTLTLLALVALVPLLLLIRGYASSMETRSYDEQQASGDVMAFTERTLSALPVVQAFGREETGDREFADLHGRSVNTRIRMMALNIRFKLGAESITALGTAGLMALGGYFVLQGSLTIGSLLVFLSYLSSLYSPLETLAYVSSGFAGAAANARRVIEVLETDDGVHDAPDAVPLPKVEGHVRFENLTAGYEHGQAVLNDISLDVTPGETIAIIGATGAGKSTLMAMLPRLFDPWEGGVRIDQYDVRNVTLASLRSQIAILLQEPFLLPVTIAENIAYGRPGASRAEIEAAARAANAHLFIERLPLCYDTILGERGASLSGGERQRLAIARALLKNAPILILDEPTSALDARTEALFLDALERLMNGRTVFIIAHRLSTIRQADRIVVLESGRIIEIGNHEQLMQRGGLYRHFYSLQSARRHSSASFGDSLFGGLGRRWRHETSTQ